jgi:hypothetical protein
MTLHPQSSFLFPKAAKPATRSVARLTVAGSKNRPSPHPPARDRVCNATAIDHGRELTSCSSRNHPPANRPSCAFDSDPTFVMNSSSLRLASASVVMVSSGAPQRRPGRSGTAIMPRGLPVAARVGTPPVIKFGGLARGPAPPVAARNSTGSNGGVERRARNGHDRRRQRRDLARGVAPRVRRFHRHRPRHQD